MATTMLATTHQAGHAISLAKAAGGQVVCTLQSDVYEFAAGCTFGNLQVCAYNAIK